MNWSHLKFPLNITPTYSKQAITTPQNILSACNSDSNVLWHVSKGIKIYYYSLHINSYVEIDPPVYSAFWMHFQSSLQRSDSNRGWTFKGLVKQNLAAIKNELFCGKNHGISVKGKMLKEDNLWCWQITNQETQFALIK